jgi:riboflavin kinase / FMN adenylyltransferase
MKDTQPVTLSGIVTRFKGNGRRLGYPTANLTIKTDLADGIYFGFADLDTWTGQPAIIFIGIPTTVGDKVRRVEVHLLDIPDIDYYDRPLSVSLRSRYRDSRTFDGIEALLEAMRADETAARQWFAANAA